MTKPIPEGMSTLTPSLTIKGAAEAIEFYKRAFGAEELARAMDPSGKKIWHAMLQIGDSRIMLNDFFEEMGGRPDTSSMWIYTDKVDAAFDRAIKAGGKVVMAVTDMFWGDRTGTLTDPWGHRWTIGQHMKDMTPAEMKMAQDAFVAQMKKR